MIAARSSETPFPVWAAAASEIPQDLGIEWDAENRLLAVKQGGPTLASFAYDGEGRRSTKTAGGITTSYAYDGPQFLEERPSAGATKRYVYGPGIDQVFAQVVSGTVSYNVADHLGSVVRVTNTAGNPTLTREYDPWGNLLQGSSTGGYAYTGREWDPESGLYYYRARYYDATLGRFSSEDPLGFFDGPNPYVYVGSSPLTRTDPTGLAQLCCRPSIVPTACHCWLTLDGGLTLGCYRIKTTLNKAKNHPEDKLYRGKKDCWDIPPGCEDGIKQEYARWPPQLPYGRFLTSNSGPALWLSNSGWKGSLPSCAWR